MIIAQKERRWRVGCRKRASTREAHYLYTIGNQIVVTILGYGLAFLNLPSSDLVFYGLLSLAVVSHLVLALPLFCESIKVHYK